MRIILLFVLLPFASFSQESLNFKPIHTGIVPFYYCESPVFIYAKRDSLEHFKLKPLNAKRLKKLDDGRLANFAIRMNLSAQNNVIVISGTDTTARIPWDLNHYTISNGLKWYKAKHLPVEITVYEENVNNSKTLIWHDTEKESFTYYVWPMSNEESKFLELGYITERRKEFVD